MTSAFGILRTACVWVLLPLTLVSGLPQMRCRCAEAQSKRYCECCYSSTNKPDSDDSLSSCCRNHEAAVKSGGSGQADACPTCGTVHARRQSGCCYLKDGDARIVSSQVDVQDQLLTQCLMTWIVPAQLAPAAAGLPQAVELADPFPPLDRVIVFRHLLI